MEVEATFCDTCQKIASEIDVYYKFQKASYNKENQLPFSPRELKVKTKEIPLGTLKDLQSRIECTSCQDIARRLVQGGREPPAQVVLEFHVLTHAGFFIWGDSTAHTYLDLWRMEKPSKAHEVGRLFNPQQVNVEILRQWIHCCHTSHGEHCHEIEIPSPLSHIYLIDVVEGCLISANIETRYVALSYV